MKALLKSFFCNRQGNVAIEFAFVGPILLVAILGLIESGRAYFTYSNMRYAADEAGRYAAVYVTATDQAIIDKTTQSLFAMNAADVTVTVADQLVSGKTYKQISLTHNFVSVGGTLLNMGTIPISVQTTVPVLP